MQNFGNSLAFWKKSPPKDQFASNPKPSETFSPTGISNQNNTSVANNRPSNYPFGNQARNGNTSSGFGSNNTANSSFQNQPGFGQDNRVASRSGFGSRSPYSNQMPGTSSGQFGGSSQFNAGGSSQFNSTPNNTSPNNNYNKSFAGQTGGGFSNPSASNGSPGTGSSGTGSSGFSAGSNMNTQTNSGSFSGTQNFNTSTPSSNFRNNQSGFQPGAGTYVPNNTPPGSNTGSPAEQNNTQPTPSSNWKNYPSTNYPGFGSTSSKSSFETPESNSGFQSKNVPASANMSPPPSLPSSVFDKKGGYAPGSTGNGGRASQAGFESSNSLYSPPSGSKIPSSSDLYSPN